MIKERLVAPDLLLNLKAINGRDHVAVQAGGVKIGGRSRSTSRWWKSGEVCRGGHSRPPHGAQAHARERSRGIAGAAVRGVRKISRRTARVGGWGSHHAKRLFFESIIVRSGISTTALLSSPRHLSPAEPRQIHQKEVQPCESRNPLDSSPLQCWHWASSALSAAAVITRLLSFGNHLSNKRQRAGWHRNAEFHRYSQE